MNPKDRLPSSCVSPDGSARRCRSCTSCSGTSSSGQNRGSQIHKMDSLSRLPTSGCVHTSADGSAYCRMQVLYKLQRYEHVRGGIEDLNSLRWTHCRDCQLLGCVHTSADGSAHYRMQVLYELQRYELQRGRLRDHRALCLNADDWWRCSQVPAAKNANFRSLPGIVEHADGGGALPFSPAVSLPSFLAYLHGMVRVALALRAWPGPKVANCQSSKTRSNFLPQQHSKGPL